MLLGCESQCIRESTSTKAIMGRATSLSFRPVATYQRFWKLCSPITPLFRVIWYDKWRMKASRKPLGFHIASAAASSLSTDFHTHNERVFGTTTDIYILAPSFVCTYNTEPISNWYLPLRKAHANFPRVQKETA